MTAAQAGRQAAASAVEVVGGVDTHKDTHTAAVVDTAGRIADLDELLGPLVAQINPGLLALKGVGPEVAGQLLVTAGENADRLTSEAAFAMLCGVAPLGVSDGLCRSRDRMLRRVPREGADHDHDRAFLVVAGG